MAFYRYLIEYLSDFVSEILPKIHDTIKFLHLKSFSMEHVRLATAYPNLFHLNLYEIDGERAIDLFVLFFEVRSMLYGVIFISIQCHIFNDYINTFYLVQIRINLNYDKI